jgi:hypothetical protein
VAWLAKTVLTDENKRNLREIAEELKEIRNLINELAETLVNLSDKKLMESFNATLDNLKENQVESYKEKLEKQVDIAKKELRS